MGRTEKNRGKAFEYWFAEELVRHGWEAKRNPLSGSSVQIMQGIGRHDVRAKKGAVRMFSELKKTSKDQITLHWKWFEKMHPAFQDAEGLVVEPVVFAFQPKAGKRLQPVVCLRLDDFLGLIELIQRYGYDTPHNP